MTFDAAQQIRLKLPALQQAYLKRLQGQLPELARLRALLEASNLPQADSQKLYRLTHNFKGSGSTFGFHAISTTARDIHETLKHAVDHDKVAVLDFNHILALFGAFEEACVAAINSAPTLVENAPADGPVQLGDGIEEKHVVIYNEQGGAGELLQQLMRFGYQAERVFNMRQFAAATQLPIHAAIIYSDFADTELDFIRTACAGAMVIIISTRTDFEARLMAVRLGAATYFVEAEVDILKVMDKIEQLADRRDQAPNTHVLIVEDDEVLGQFYSNSLQQSGITTTLVTDPKQALQAMQERAVDILLLDFSMPFCDGAELAAVIRQHEQFVRLPIIFMSAKEDLERRLMNAGLGIDDYLIKPFTPEQLLAVIRSRAQRAAELRGLMVRDSFTGLYNHAQFNELLNREVSQALRNNTPGVYAMIDLDHFKQVNDSYGHGAGDKVIRALSRLLQQRLRRSDIIGRCGGEEFGVLMPYCAMDDAVAILESLRESFATTPFTFGQQVVHVTFSAGVSAMDGHLATEQLVSKTDHALYQAKAAGRNRLLVA